MGTQHKFLLKIPQGQVSIDAKRGQIFLISLNMYGRYVPNDMTAFSSGVNRFITDHLPFEILKYYPNANIDNHFNGIGIHGVYDSKYDRVIISKLDYIPQIEYRGVILYDEALDKYYINKHYGTTVLRQYVNLTDTQYFCNKSWTLSFDMNTSSWVSFHSYIPNFYIAENNFFYSGLNGGCDLEAIALQEITTTTTTSTSTTAAPCCNLSGTAVFVPGVCETDGTAISVGPCDLDGKANASITTTTTTTTLPPLDFSTSYGCDFGNITVNSTSTSGGVPPYFYGTTYFLSESEALANESWVEASSIGYGVGVTNGTYWIVAKDSVNTLKAKSVTTGCF
jgi:hypothetical protein